MALAWLINHLVKKNKVDDASYQAMGLLSPVP